MIAVSRNVLSGQTIKCAQGVGSSSLTDLCASVSVLQDGREPRVTSANVLGAQSKTPFSALGTASQFWTRGILEIANANVRTGGQGSAVTSPSAPCRGNQLWLQIHVRQRKKQRNRNLHACAVVPSVAPQQSRTACAHALASCRTEGRPAR
jgi:hypothetical protein